MSVLDEYDIGDTPTLTAEFSVSNIATDPTAVTLVVTDPSGNTDTYTYAASQITRDGTGSYSKDVTVDEAGEWVAVWTGSGTVAATGTTRFAVRRAGA